MLQETCCLQEASKRRSRAVDWGDLRAFTAERMKVIADLRAKIVEHMGEGRPPCYGHIKCNCGARLQYACYRNGHIHAVCEGCTVSWME